MNWANWLFVFYNKIFAIKQLVVSGNLNGDKVPTVTLKLHLLELPEESVAIIVTFVVPIDFQKLTYSKNAPMKQ